MREITLTPKRFRELLQQKNGTEEIGRLLRIAADDFRDKKLVPHLFNLQTVLITTELAFDSINISGLGELITGLKLNGSAIESMRELVCKAQRLNRLSLIQKNASWACSHIASVVREGLAVYESAQDYSSLLVFRSGCKKTKQTGLLLVEDYKTDRSYAYRYKYEFDSSGRPQAEEFNERKERNFPRIEGRSEIELGGKDHSIPTGVSQMSSEIPSVKKRGEFWSNIDLNQEFGKPVFYFWCRLPLPFQETVLPLAKEQLRLRLRKSTSYQAKAS